MFISQKDRIRLTLSLQPDAIDPAALAQNTESKIKQIKLARPSGKKSMHKDMMMFSPIFLQ